MKRNNILAVLGSLLIAAASCCNAPETENCFEIGPTAEFNGFHAPWSGLDDETQFRCFSDNDYLYFLYTMVDSTITLCEPFVVETDVNPEDRIEIFFCADAAMTDTYYCAEIDPLGRVMDYSCKYYREIDYDWNFQTLETLGKLTDNGYIVAGKVAKSELIGLGMNLDAFWMGVFRDDFGSFEEPIWYSVIPTDDQNPDFHKPDILFKARIK